MSRTNKQWIASKKAQQIKQARRSKWSKRFDYPQRNLSIDDAKELGIIGTQVNPRGRTYHRFLSGRKVCRETRLRTDPDGFRMVIRPSGWAEMVSVMMSGWMRSRIAKSVRK